jgi:hypothetical protein
MKYYSSADMQQHNFYRMPKMLICDEKYKGLSNNAKLLYTIILDRASLSESNAWIDEQNKVVVFLTIDEACKLLNIGHNTATKIFKELDDYGLIERKKQGFARANIIYPKLPQPTEK